MTDDLKKHSDFVKHVADNNIGNGPHYVEKWMAWVMVDIHGYVWEDEIDPNRLRRKVAEINQHHMEFANKNPDILEAI